MLRLWLGLATCKRKWKSFSCVQLFVTPWTIQSLEYSRPESWSEVAIPFSRGSSQPRFPALQADSLPAEPPGKPGYV